MTDTYLDMMKDSLIKKIEILEQLLKENEIQRKVLEDPENVDEKDFDDAVERKSDLIEELNKLNDGFQGLYDKVSTVLQVDRDRYKNEIVEMQKMIRTITDLSGKVEAGELRNKLLADNYFSTMRKTIKEGRKRACASYGYYKNMNKSQVIMPQMFDSKQ